MSVGRFLGLLKRACVRAFEDNCLEVAKGVAYSALLSFFPALMVAAAIACACAATLAAERQPLNQYLVDPRIRTRCVACPPDAHPAPIACQPLNWPGCASSWRSLGYGCGKGPKPTRRLNICAPCTSLT